MTRILTRGDLEAVLEPAACMAALKEGFCSTDSWSATGQRVRTDLPFPGTATALIPGLLPGIDAYTVKVNVLDSVDEMHRPIARLCEDIEPFLRARVQANLHASWTGSRRTANSEKRSASCRKNGASCEGQ